MRPRQISIVDEEVFFQRQLRITALEVARAIARHTVAQSEVLSAAGARIGSGLHESQLVDGAPKVVGLKIAIAQWHNAQMIQRDPHTAMIFQCDAGR